MKTKTILSIGIASALIITALSIAFYLVIFLPSKERAKEKAAEEATLTRENCQKEARTRAQELLKKLYDTGVLTGAEKLEYERVKDSGLARREDIRLYFEECLSVHGLTP